MQSFSIFAILLSFISFGQAQNITGRTGAVMRSFEDSASYAIGTSIGLNLLNDFSTQGITGSSINKSLLLLALSEAFNTGETLLNQEQSSVLMSAFFERLNSKRGDKNLLASNSFLEENKDEPGVVTTESGLQYIVLQEGNGPSPTLEDQVVVHYTGKLLNGEVFDSSVERNEPVTFYVRSVIPGWTEALQLMKPGAVYKLFIPGNLAYGDQGNPRGGIGPNEVLIFDVKLIDVLK